MQHNRYGEAPEMELVYFDTKGLAETSRFLLALGNGSYIDTRYPCKLEDGKYVKDEFDAHKTEGRFRASMDRLPMLIVGNYTISQSKSIERFLAKKHGLMGSNPIEEAQIDAVCESIRDIRDRFYNLGYYRENNFLEKKGSYFEELKYELELLSNLMHGKYSVGDKLSLADISLYIFVTNTFSNIHGHCHTEESLRTAFTVPKIREVIVSVSKEPKVREWTTKYPTI